MLSYQGFSHGCGDRTQIALQSCTLDDRSAFARGTRLRATRLKTIINRFLFASYLLKVQALSYNDKKTQYPNGYCVFMVAGTGLEPATSGL